VIDGTIWILAPLLPPNRENRSHEGWVLMAVSTASFDALFEHGQRSDMVVFGTHGGGVGMGLFPSIRACDLL